MSQGDGDCCKGKVGSNVPSGVHECWASNSSKFILGDWTLERGLLCAEQVYEAAVSSTDDDMDRRDKPWVWEGEEDGFVLEVEGDVESIPESNVGEGDNGWGILGTNYLCNGPVREARSRFKYMVEWGMNEGGNPGSRNLSIFAVSENHSLLQWVKARHSISICSSRSNHR